jgi:hypothetical protein
MTAVRRARRTTVAVVPTPPQQPQPPPRGLTPSVEATVEREVREVFAEAALLTERRRERQRQQEEQRERARSLERQRQTEANAGGGSVLRPTPPPPPPPAGSGGGVAAMDPWCRVFHKQGGRPLPGHMPPERWTGWVRKDESPDEGAVGASGEQQHEGQPAPPKSRTGVAGRRGSGGSSGRSGGSARTTGASGSRHPPPCHTLESEGQLMRRLQGFGMGEEAAQHVMKAAWRLEGFGLATGAALSARTVGSDRSGGSKPSGRAGGAGGGVGGGALALGIGAMGRTVWVGAVPASCCEDGSPELKRAFEVFGKVQSVTVRRKDGERKNWALVTFAQREAATCALRAAMEIGVHVAVTDSATSESSTAAMPGQVSRRSTGVDQRCKLVVRQARIDTELSRPETGALGRMWASQER